MADNEQELEIKPKGGKKKLIVIILAALLVLGGGGGAAWFFLFANKDDAAKKEGEHGAESEHAAESDKTPEELEAEKKAFYIKLPRSFVFNAVGQVRDRLVQIKVTLLVRGPENEALAKQHSPLIEGTLLQVFSHATVEQLTSAEGKQKLKEDANQEVKKVLNDIAKKEVVDEILFTGFVMQ